MNIKTTFFNFLLVFLLISCEKEVNFNFDQQSKLCLNCILNPDSIITATLTLSQSLDNTKSTVAVKNGIINLFEEGKFIGSFETDNNGRYFLNINPGEGKKYKIIADVDNYPSITAETNVPTRPQIEYSKEITGNLVYDSTLETFNLNVKILDKPGKDNYWITSNWVVNDVRYGGFVKEINAPFLDGFNKTYDSEAKYGYTIFLGLRLSDEGYDGQPMEFVIPDYVEGTARRYTEAVYFLNADEHYDKYIKTSIINRMKETSELPFFEPVQIHSNISGGYGIFGSCAITKIKL